MLIAQLLDEIFPFLKTGFLDQEVEVCYPGCGRKKRGGVHFLWVDTEQWSLLISECLLLTSQGKRGEYYSLV